MEIIRGRLSAADLSPSSLRYNPDTDTVQYTPDGGTTWVDDPSDDPRVGLKFLKPLKTGSDIRCRSAASMVMWLRNFIEYEAGLMTLGAGVTALGNGFLTFLSPIAPYFILARVVFEGAEALFTIGATALTAAFDEGTWDALLCIFFCNIASDGSVTDGKFETIQGLISSDLNTTAALVLNLILQTQGRVGFQNAGVLYEVEGADCSDCECNWCYEMDFALSDFGWSVVSAANYNAGVGWQSQVSGGSALLGITRTFAATNIIDITLTFNRAVDAGGGSSAMDLKLGGSILSTRPLATGAGDHVAGESVGTTLDQVSLFIDNNGSTAINTVSKIKFRGTGDNPFGADNC